MTIATRAPGLTHRNRRLAFGPAQYSTESIRLKMTSSTGHLAMSHVVTSAELAPMTWPTWRAMLPVTTTMRADAASNTTSRRVTPYRSGYVFQAGLPSGTP